MGDPNIDDIDRTGADLLERIGWLVGRHLATADARNGWAPLLLACVREIERLYKIIDSFEEAVKQ